MASRGDRQDSNVIHGSSSVVGIGMRIHYGVAEKMFEALAEAKVNIYSITNSEIRMPVKSSDFTYSLVIKELALIIAIRQLGLNWLCFCFVLA